MTEKKQLYIQCDECLSIGDVVVVDETQPEGFKLTLCGVCEGKGYVAVPDLYLEVKEKAGNAA